MEPKQRSTESYGIGQSGYTAGRVQGDRSLEREIDVQNASYPDGADETPGELGVDDRFTGRGGRPGRSE